MYNRAASWIIGIEVLGCLMIILIIWADELLDIPHKLFNASASLPRISEALLESGLVLLLGTIVVIVTILMVMSKRIRELESFIRVCAWCKKLKIGDSWITLEQYLEEYQGTRSSHGICREFCHQFKSGQGQKK
jgi:hypothetical protein